MTALDRKIEELEAAHRHALQQGGVWSPRTLSVTFELERLLDLRDERERQKRREEVRIHREHLATEDCSDEPDGASEIEF